MACQITGVSIVYSNVCSGADQRKHQSSASLAFVRGIHRWPVNSPQKGPVTRKMFPFDDVIMKSGLAGAKLTEGSDSRSWSCISFPHIRTGVTWCVPSTNFRTSEYSHDNICVVRMKQYCWNANSFSNNDKSTQHYSDATRASYGVSDHRYIDWLFNSVLLLTTKKQPSSALLTPFWGQIIGGL